MLGLDRCVNFVRTLYGLSSLDIIDARRPGSIFKCMEIGTNSIVFIERDGTCDLFLNGNKEGCLTLYDVFIRILILEN
jgi:hypothetical protein